MAYIGLIATKDNVPILDADVVDILQRIHFFAIWKNFIKLRYRLSKQTYIFTNNFLNTPCFLLRMVCNKCIASFVPILDADVVDINTTFSIENDFDESKTYTIDDSPDLSFNEIGLDHYIAKEAINKKMLC
jgi:hypothetical protein